MTDITDRYDGTLERTDDGGYIRFERHLAFPIEDVWAAITTPERLAEWWLPFPADITVDLREGGEMVFTAEVDEPFTITCTILKVEPPVLLEHTHADPGSVMRWELEPFDTGCVLRLSHFVPDPADALDKGFLVGLHTSLSRLEPCLAGSPVPWDWDELAVSQAAYAELGLANPVEESEPAKG
jgi:uncharacterized protein YndB with AHSA1/START domain